MKGKSAQEQVPSGSCNLRCPSKLVICFPFPPVHFFLCVLKKQKSGWVEKVADKAALSVEGKFTRQIFELVEGMAQSSAIP